MRKEPVTFKVEPIYTDEQGAWRVYALAYAAGEKKADRENKLLMGQLNEEPDIDAASVGRRVN